jgi:hypothetical protein
MNARLLLSGPRLVICVGLSASTGVAQGTPLRLGPLGVTVPPGWSAQANVVPVRINSPESNPAQFFSAQFFPPEQTSQTFDSITRRSGDEWPVRFRLR